MELLSEDKGMTVTAILARVLDRCGDKLKAIPHREYEIVDTVVCSLAHEISGLQRRIEILQGYPAKQSTIAKHERCIEAISRCGYPTVGLSVVEGKHGWVTAYGQTADDPTENDKAYLLHFDANDRLNFFALEKARKK